MHTDRPTLTMLGTGNAMVTKCYNTCFTINNGGRHFLVDAGGGNGILSQLEKAGIDIEKVCGMFITHTHTDHILGAIWVIRKIAMLITYDGRQLEEFPVYCHEKAANMLFEFCRMTFNSRLLATMQKNVPIITVSDGETAESAGFKLTFFDINSEKEKQFGIKAILPDGKNLVCLGDEPFNASCKKYAENADWILCEAFCLYEERNIFHPYEKHHSTALDASRIAQDLHARNLVLYHTEDTALEQRKVRYTAEARQVFEGNIFVPDDLENIIL